MSIRTPIPRKSYNEPQYMLKEKATIPAKRYDELKYILKEEATEEDYIYKYTSKQKINALH
jgi:hypothetical protein